MSNSNDDELAPMVDGLSGALCIFILITTVFMLSATDMVLSNLNDSGLKFNNSVLFMKEKKLEFKGGVKISYQDVYAIREDLKKMSSPTLYVYIPEGVQNRTKKIIFNIAQLKKKLNADFSIKYMKGEDSKCGKFNSCIYWRDN